MNLLAYRINQSPIYVRRATFLAVRTGRSAPHRPGRVNKYAFHLCPTHRQNLKYFLHSHNFLYFFSGGVIRIFVTVKAKEAIETKA